VGAKKRWTDIYLGIAMIENLSTLIGMLVRSDQQNQNSARIPLPIAVELNTDEAWQDFQESSRSYDMEYATTLCGTL
jgi:hypothetical protein